MTVYRLERDGWGVFADMDIQLEYPPDALYEEFTCTLEDYRGMNDRFGCESLESLVDYFGSDFGRILEQGAEIVVYKVDKRSVKFSKVKGLEVSFKYNKATKISI